MYSQQCGQSQQSQPPLFLSPPPRPRVPMCFLRSLASMFSFSSVPFSFAFSAGLVRLTPLKSTSGETCDSPACSDLFKTTRVLFVRVLRMRLLWPFLLLETHIPILPPLFDSTFSPRFHYLPDSALQHLHLSLFLSSNPTSCRQVSFTSFLTDAQRIPDTLHFSSITRSTVSLRQSGSTGPLQLSGPSALFCSSPCVPTIGLFSAALFLSLCLPPPSVLLVT